MALALVVVLVIWVIALIRGGASSSTALPSGAAASEGASPGAAVDGSPEGGEGTSPPAPARPRVSDYPTGSTPPPPGGCPPDWAVLTVTAPDSTPSGQPVPATIHVTTSAEGDPCLVDLGAQALAVDVYSGEDHVWSSATCPFTPESRQLLLPPDAVDVAEVRWNGYRSSDGCGAEGEVAQPGTYRFVVTHTLAGETLSAETTFLVGP